MKKTVKNLISIILCLIMTAALFMGCASNQNTDVSNEENNSTDNTVTDAPAERITVTFKDGLKKLGVVESTKGAKLDASSYSAFFVKEGFEFLGWYETPSFLEASKKDPATDVFTETTVLYGSFKSLETTADTRKWYIVGDSPAGGLLKESKWAGDVAADMMKKFELTSTGNATNEFSLTFDLFEGDQFQVIHDWQWDDQKGFACFTEIDGTQFESGGSLGGSADKANINVLVSGNYTITLTTDPDNKAYDTLSVVRNGEPLTEAKPEEKEPFAVTESTGVKVKGSWVADWSELKDLARNDGTDTWSITMELAADTELCFSVFDGDSDTGIVLKESNVTDEASKALIAKTGNNIKTAAAGTYTFTVDLTTMTVTVTK